MSPLSPILISRQWFYYFWPNPNLMPASPITENLMESEFEGDPNHRNRKRKKILGLFSKPITARIIEGLPSVSVLPTPQLHTVPIFSISL